MPTGVTGSRRAGALDEHAGRHRQVRAAGGGGRLTAPNDRKDDLMTLVNDERAPATAGDSPVTDRPPEARIGSAARGDAARLAASLAAAFYDDPVFRWFSPHDQRREAMLPDFFGVFVDAYLSHGETYIDDAGSGGALWAAPDSDPLGAEPVYAERLEAIAGVDAPRLFEIVELLEGHSPHEPHYHLQFLGVRPERQGAGLGAALMAPILQRCDRDGTPAYLEATSDRNRALYERHGFRARGDIPLPSGPALWRMWRDPVA
jgi:GNAT superfamily N-acetyltransferase